MLCVLGMLYVMQSPAFVMTVKKGKVVEIYETNYKNLIKSMGYSHWDLKAIQKLYKRDCFVNRSNTQIKAELKYSEISKFKLIWKIT